VWLVTFGLTVMADLTTAVEFGMILAALTFIRDVAETTSVSPVNEDFLSGVRLHLLHDKHIPEYVEVFSVQGALLFGAAQKLEVILHRLDSLPLVVILRLRGMNAIDCTGLGAIEELNTRLTDSGRHLLLCGAKEHPAQLLHQSVFVRQIGAENICNHIQQALDRAAKIHAAAVAAGASYGKNPVTQASWFTPPGPLTGSRAVPEGAPHLPLP
jgi:SulP family sulfate permease